MAEFKIEIHNQGVVEAFNQYLQAFQDPTAALDAVGQVVKSNIQLGFATGTDPWGTPWAPLVVRQGQPLVQTGLMRDSIDYQVSGNTVTVGTNAIQAALQNFGGTVEAKNAPYLCFPTGDGQFARKKSVTIPARTFIPTTDLPDAWVEDIVAAIQSVILGKS